MLMGCEVSVTVEEREMLAVEGCDDDDVDDVDDDSCIDCEAEAMGDDTNSPASPSPTAPPLARGATLGETSRDSSENSR